MNKHELIDCPCELSHPEKWFLLWLEAQDNITFFREFIENEVIHNHIDFDTKVVIKNHIDKFHSDEVTIQNIKLDDFDKAVVHTLKSAEITSIKSRLGVEK